MDLISRPSTGQAGSNAWNSSCTATEAVGDMVYVLSSGQVRRAQANAAATAKVAGVITSKPTSTTCVVVSDGPAAKSGLTAGSEHFLSASVAGGVSDAEPATGNWRVSVGRASTTAQLIVEIGEIEVV